MTDSLTNVPYARFLECQDRRRRVAADLMLPARPTVDAQVVAVASEDGISTEVEPETMHNIKVALPIVHMAGSDSHYNAHIEVGPHGFALFLAPDAEYPVLDVNGTSEQLAAVVRSLQAALASRCASDADTDRIVEIQHQCADPGIESPMTR
jgi:hypothetical protein